MTPVDQTISHEGQGDCMRAATASVLDLPIEAVPHFLLHGDKWFDVFNSLLWTLGWDFEGSGRPHKQGRKLLLEDSFDGYFLAIVLSRNFEGRTHMVVLDVDGAVVHDPSPHKNYQGENVLETGELRSWYMVSRRPGPAPQEEN
jgi:hypothetical protein